MEKNQKTATAATEAEIDVQSRKEAIMATKEITSEELKDLDNETIALKLYYLVDNSQELDIHRFMAIGTLIRSIAANLKKWKTKEAAPAATEAETKESFLQHINQYLNELETAKNPEDIELLATKINLANDIARIFHVIKL